MTAGLCAAQPIGLARTPMTILENNCMQSTASSAGYSTGGTLVSAFAAYIIINQQSMSVPLMLAWVFFIAVLGTPLLDIKPDRTLFTPIAPRQPGDDQVGDA